MKVNYIVVLLFVSLTCLMTICKIVGVMKFSWEWVVSPLYIILLYQIFLCLSYVSKIAKRST